MGGEEFVILLPYTPADQAKIFAQRLQEAIRSSRMTDGQGSRVQYTISIGLASYPQHHAESIEALLNQADKALYIAKENGRDQTVTSDG